MKQTFKIPYITKEKNVNAGRTEYSRLMYKEHHITSRVPIEKEGLYFRGTTFHSVPMKRLEKDGLTYEYITRDCNIADQVKNEFSDSITHMDTFSYYDTIRTLGGEPEYIYKYDLDKTEVECYNCHTKFPASSLEYDDDDWLSEYYSSDKVCPYCKKWDCCELKFEK